MKRIIKNRLFSMPFYISIFVGLLTASFAYAQTGGTAAPAISPQEQALLAQLEDILLPEKIGLWPPAPSVWIVLIAGPIVLSLLIYVTRSSRKKKAYRRAAQKERLHIVKFYEKHQKVATGRALAELQQKASKDLLSLLKKTYFTAYQNKRSIVAGRYGTEFIALLRATLQDKHREQAWSKVHIDNDALYRPTSAFSEKKTQNDLSKMIRHLNIFSKHWIEHHVADQNLTTIQTPKKNTSNSPGKSNTQEGKSRV